jgi:ligand-binding sensor domain-containing protein
MLDGQTWKSWTHKDGLGGANEAGLPASENTGLGTRSRHDLTTMLAGQPTYNPNYVFSIHVSPDGAVWAGTWGGGVSRFDGTKWTSYTTRDGLSGNIVYSIAHDANGVMWFGTDNGLARFDGKAWKTYGPQDGMFPGHVYAIATTPNGDVWVGARRGVVRLAKK